MIALLSIFVCDSSVRKVPLRHQDGLRTPSGTVHDILVGISFVLYIVDMLLFSVGSRPSTSGDLSWLKGGSFSLFNVAVICLIAYIIVGIKEPRRTQERPMGLAERVVILTLFEWVGILSGMLLTTSG